MKLVAREVYCVEGSLTLKSVALVYLDQIMTNLHPFLLIINIYCMLWNFIHKLLW